MVTKPEEQVAAATSDEFDYGTEQPNLQANMASPQRTTNVRPTLAPPVAAESGSPARPDVRPGISVDRTQAVVLCSRLGRPMYALPKINPNDPAEQTRYATSEAFERGERINLLDPSHVSLLEEHQRRLFEIGAIGYLDHPDAREAENMLQHRRAQEVVVANNRGIVVGLTGQQTGAR